MSFKEERLFADRMAKKERQLKEQTEVKIPGSSVLESKVVHGIGYAYSFSLLAAAIALAIAHQFGVLPKELPFFHEPVETQPVSPHNKIPANQNVAPQHKAANQGTI